MYIHINKRRSRDSNSSVTELLHVPELHSSIAYGYMAVRVRGTKRKR